jgi:hypothetical protein
LHFSSIVTLAVCALVGLAGDAAAACVAPGTAKLSQALLLRAAQPARTGAAPELAAAAQGANSNGGGPIAGLWQVVMTAFPDTPDEFIYDLGFQQFHNDGTELMISAGVPPTIGNVCIGVWERGAGGVIRLRHLTWNWSGDEVLGDAPTGYFLLDVTLRTNSRGTAYSGTWKTASYDLGTGPLGTGGPAQPGTEADGTLEATRIGVN